MTAAMKHMVANFSKLDKFDGADYRRWQTKMQFLLSTMSLVYVLTTPMPEDGENATMEQIQKRSKWENDNYRPNIWLKMHQVKSSLFKQHKMKIDEAIQVSYIIDKLHPSWKDIKHALKHKKEELTLVEFGSHLRIEESLKVQDGDKPKGNNVACSLVVNMVEHNNFIRYNDNKGKRKHQDTKTDPNKKSKLTCWKCRKLGHLKKNCKGGKVGNKANGSGTNDSVNGLSNSLNAFDSTSKLNDSILWHARLGHVQFKRMQDMSTDELILACYMDTKKCKTCMLTKITKKPFQDIKRKTEVLELIHSDLCDLHATSSLGNKKYFVKFIDNASRVPNKSNKITPYELWTKRKPNLNYPMVWGCRAVVRLLDPKLKTLGERGIKCIFVGYAKHSKAFRFFVIEPNESALINSIIESKDDIFDDNRFSSVPRPRTRDEVCNQHFYCFNTEDDPKTFDEAIKSHDVAFWKEAINDEMDSVIDGTVEKFKARLLIALASIHNLISHQMIVKTTFLNGELDEEVDLKKVILSSWFSLKDTGEADVIFGIRIKHESNGILVSRSHYIEKILKKFNYFDCTLVSTPIDTSEKLRPINGQVVSQLEYSRVIGCLMYAMTCTRPYIAFVVGKLSGYTSNPSTQHGQATLWSI
nr:zinc finger, CCHC-type [Tanacetum cinerariifolium]